MYNEEMKKRFISQYSVSPSVETICKYTFESLGKYEEKWNADFCTMPVDVITEAVEFLTGLQKQSRYQKINILKAYSKWCIDNKYPGATDAIMHVEVSGVDKARKQLICSPMHMQQILDAICCKEEYNTSDLTIRGFAWLLYSGVRDTDVASVMQQDVDLKHATIKYGIKSVPIYRESITTFEKLVDLRCFAHYKEEYEDMRAYIDRIDGQELLRGIYSLPTLLSFRQMLHQRTVSARKKGLDINASVNRIWLSGVFYRAHELEMVGIKPNFMSLAAEDMIGKEYSRNVPKVAIQKSIARDYMCNYQMWKTAFNIL